MKKIILYSILNLFALNIVLAQQSARDQKKSNAYFRVYTRVYDMTDSLFLTYQENQWDYASGVPRKVMIDKIGYQLQIPFRNGEKFHYGSFSIGKSRKLVDANIIEPNDSIVFNVLKNSVIFQGRGTEKYQLIQELENELEELNFLRDDSLSKASRLPSNKTNELTEFSSDVLKRGLMMELKYNQRKEKIIARLLEKYKKEISPNIYELLRINYLSKLEYDYLKSFNDGLSYINVLGKENADSSFKAIEKLNAKKLEYFNQAIKNDDLSALSNWGIEYLLQDIRTRKYNPITKATYSPQTVVDYIVYNYSGLLKDRLLTTYLIRKRINSDKDVKLVNNALKHIKTDYCIELLQKSMGHSSPGSLAFEFALTDTLGNVVKQSDFKGKVVLLDFFFTGCGSCKILNEKMSPIVELYKDNPNMKFVSINVDKDRKEWKNSIRGLEYTHKGSIDLFTNGDATNSKIIQHYNVIGYPTLILVGKNGKIISTSAPEPSAGKAAEAELIRMINEALLAK